MLILYISGGTYSLKLTPNDRFFEKLFMAILFTLRDFVRNLLRGNCRRNTFRISFWFLVWDSNPGFSSNKPTHYLLDHSDAFILILISWNLYSFSKFEVILTTRMMLLISTLHSSAYTRITKLVWIASEHLLKYWILTNDSSHSIHL